MATAIAFIGGLVLPEWFFGQQGWLFALRSALFMPLGDNSYAHPLISPGWTLIYEFAFYTILALCLLAAAAALRAGRGVDRASSSCSARLSAKRCRGSAFMPTKLLMLEFLFGMAVGRRSCGGLPLRPWQGLVLAGRRAGR